jgi:hypothetical protein
MTWSRERHGQAGVLNGCVHDARRKDTPATTRTCCGPGGANTYTNDANRNTLTGGGRTNTWDSRSRLYQCANGGPTSRFTYGADGLRRCMVVRATTTNHVRDGSMSVRELSDTGTGKATCLAGTRGPSQYARRPAKDGDPWARYRRRDALTGF